MKFGWHKISLLFLLLIAVIGTSLRGVSLFSLPFEYGHLVHAHSHIAFQGWIYTLIFLFLSHLFLEEKQILKRKYPLQFKITIVLLVGILVSFSLQGYALYSILFSSLFQLANYWFIFSFLKDTRAPKNNKLLRPVSILFVRTGLILGLLSTLAPWGIGILAAKGQSGSEAYEALVYFFLHFQYNGWFLFVVLGIFFKCLENDSILIDRNYGSRFYYLMIFAVFPALGLSYLGMSFRSFAMPFASIAAVLQLIGITYFLLIFGSLRKQWLNKQIQWVRILLFAFVLSFVSKSILQLLSVFPAFEELAFHNKHLILAYLHLCFIGVISFLLLAILLKYQWTKTSPISSIGNILLLAGFGLSELLLLSDGLFIYSNHFILFLSSGAMAIGILLLLIAPGKH